MTRDPVCGMQIDQQKAAGKAEYRGVTCYFCSQGCQKEFQLHPDKHTVAQREHSGAPHGHGQH